MWGWTKNRLRQALRRWLLDGNEIGTSHSPPSQGPGVESMAMSHVGQGNLQVAQAAGPVTVNHKSLTLHVQASTDKRVIVEEVEMFLHDQPPKPHVRSNLVTNEQLEVLKLMRECGNEPAVLAWMQKQFSTRRVLDLDDEQLRRIRGYCLGIIRRIKIKEEEEMRPFSAGKKG